MTPRIDCTRFWKEQPALHAGLCLLCGAAAALTPSWTLLVPALVLFCNWRCALRALVLASLAFAYTLWLYPSPSFTQDKISGTASFHIENLKIQPSPFHKSFLYKGKITQFISDEGIAYNLPCTVYLPFQKNRPSAHIDYTIQGTLHANAGKKWQLKPVKLTRWEPIQNTWSLAEYRFQAKEKVRAFLKKQIPDPKSASFLTALATGDIDERALTLEFGKLGIQHILAISGFHFALIAAFLSFFLRLFLTPKKTAILLLLFLSVYFAFIGGAPSVCRAWMAISLFLIAQIAGLRLSALNALGIGLIVEILCDPLLILHMGFQLSFLATLAILLLFPAFNQCICHLLPKRPLKTIASMPRLDQHVYLVGATLRNMLSLNLAVHVTTIPLLLFLFHKFPLLSLAYNLFFPFGAGLALLLLCIASITSLLVPPLGYLLHTINSNFTSLLLTTAMHPPAFLDYILRVQPFPLPLLLAFFSLLFYAGIHFHQKVEDPIILKYKN